MMGGILTGRRDGRPGLEAGISSRDMTIRPARPGDRDFVVATAERLAVFGPPPWRTAEEIVGAEAETLRAFFDGLADRSTLLIAESEEGDPLGLAYLEPAQDYFTREEHGHVGILAVVGHAEGRGIGGGLLRAAEAWARERGYRRLTLNVFEGNRSARAVYEHVGYVAETLRYVKML
jgi:GNAT superfamily N-acetyltransferase